MSIFLYAAIGGFFGSISRFYIANKFGTPLGTWITNITGSLLLAFLASELLPIPLGEVAKSYVSMFGFCGAFTTFSTFGKETLEFILEGKFVQAGFYVLSSFLVAFFAFFLVFAL